MKYYAVRRGRKPGIYTNPNDAQAQTKGFSNAEMKSFLNLADAQAYFNDLADVNKNIINGKFYVVQGNNQENVFTTAGQTVDFLLEHQKRKIFRYDTYTEVIKNIHQRGIVLYTDGSYIEEYGCYSGAFVAVNADDKIVHEESFTGNRSRFIKARNTAGEALAILRALKWAVDNGYREIMLVTDSDTVVQWTKKEKLSDWIANYFMKHLRIIKKIQNLKIHFKIVKSHSGNYYNNYVDRLTREVIYQGQQDIYYRNQFTSNEKFLIDFLKNHASMFHHVKEQNFLPKFMKIIDTQEIDWLAASQSVVMIGKLIPSYGTYLMLIYNDGDRLNHIVGKIHSRNLFRK